MDILVKSVLDYIQSQAGHTNAILAGGAVRDGQLNLEPNDYDICVPSKSPKDIDQLLLGIGEEFGVETLMKSKDYGITSKSSRKKSSRRLKTDGQNLTSVYGFTFEGKKIDIIGHFYEDDEEFADNVIDNFDFGINMVYDTGSFVYDNNRNYREDRDWGQISLINLLDITQLPNAMVRFNKLNDRLKAQHGRSYIFRAPCLLLNHPKKEKESLKFSEKMMYSDSFDAEEEDLLPAGPPVGWANAPSPAATPATGQLSPQVWHNAVNQLGEFTQAQSTHTHSVTLPPLTITGI